MGSQRDLDCSLLEAFIRKVRWESSTGEFFTSAGTRVYGTLIDPNWVCMLEDQLAYLTSAPKRGRPQHDWHAKISNPTRRNTELMVDKEMKKLMAETGKKRVKAKAVKKVAKLLHLSEDAIWKRIRK
jgi:hypothetical protein